MQTELNTLADKSPQQIRAEKEAQKRAERAEALRRRFRAEAKFLALPADVKLEVKRDLLYSLGFSKDKPLREQSFLIRLIYYKKGGELHRNSYFMDYFERHAHEYHRTDDRRPDRRAMVRHDAGREIAAPDFVH
jgi:hypothetical protein